jgi:hypothetical protein
MEHSFISMRLRTRPGPAVNGHGVIPKNRPPRHHRPCAGDPDEVMRGASPHRDGRDKPGHDLKEDTLGQPSMHGWVEANFTRNGPKRDLEPFFRAI